MRAVNGKLIIQLQWPNRSGRFFVQHVRVVGKWLALWKYFKLAAKVKTPLPLPIL